jgi:hypothetical protein
MAYSRRRLDGPDCSDPYTRLSWTYPLPQRHNPPGCRPSDPDPRTGAISTAPFLRFLASSAHQAPEVHRHGVPSPLRSAFVVSATLTVCSLRDPAGLFHPAALMTFRDGSRIPSPKRRSRVAPVRFPACHPEVPPTAGEPTDRATHTRTDPKEGGGSPTAHLLGCHPPRWAATAERRCRNRGAPKNGCSLGYTTPGEVAHSTRAGARVNPWRHSQVVKESRSS